ncbi:ABC transporter ATP-binding protein [Frigidibacter mobilis]|uniref:Spermidine/putrescine import ATP-binding protein PotA n=1 Tax=Frigidibacter mobilis TaxID=1335048 RepID=A0A159Z6G1_9RHOB|nr:ABC transporter ATP-binding protein [Frigidibacter mobilis]AMY70927.1 ABC transporter nucleotide binding/ATPase protein [Frigidibacter mobilis]
MADHAVELRNVTKRFGDYVAVRDIDLTIRKGEFFTMLGASGCGKTTTLRLIAGFELPSEGQVLIGGQNMTDSPAYARPVHTVFQSYALFPHLNILENVAFPLRVRRLPKAERNERARAALDLVQMQQFADRKPSQLSGGQQQRVALARALVNEPEVLLLDEPLGALDLKLRKEMQLELKEIQRRLGITFVFVTHDQEEALTMSDRIALMQGGRVEQLADPVTLYDRPESRYVAEFIGETNLLPAAILPDGSARLFGKRIVLAQTRLAEGPATLAIRPETIRRLAPGVAAIADAFTATLRDRVFIGTDLRLVYDVDGGGEVVVRIQNRSDAGPPPELGEKVRLVLRSEDMRAFSN